MLYQVLAASLAFSAPVSKIASSQVARAGAAQMYAVTLVMEDGSESKIE
eukprot:CAMPEP_0115868772 /NCGR_PEP_ID=MMETSP0287-20121206/21465_1 /TAXON_ID=412157 /ORGANISM="Chrysochromulina rotalis, Strain UIO044" /LENGTH=48 /DNA_ID= /DNA_START= /DNA_END= /DNA_ORIENTATION=